MQQPRRPAAIGRRQSGDSLKRLPNFQLHAFEKWTKGRQLGERPALPLRRLLYADA